MALPANNNMHLRDDNIESIVITPDLQHLAESTESVLHNLSEIANCLQSQEWRPLKAEKARSSIADLQLKRRKEFENKFNLIVKRSKLDRNVKTVAKERTLNKVKISLVEIPQYPLKNFELRDCATTDALLGFHSIKKEPEDELNPTNLFTKNESVVEDFATLLRNPMGISDTVSSNIRKSDIKEEPGDEFDASNLSILPSGVSFLERSYTSSIQQDAFQAYVENCINTANNENADFQIGPNGTRVLIKDLRKVNWTGVSLATRTLLNFIFGHQTLGTHSLSGKPSPAFLNYTSKRQLDPLKIGDLIYFMKQRFGCSESEIRYAITMKCSDSAKALKKDINIQGKIS